MACLLILCTSFIYICICPTKVDSSNVTAAIPSKMYTFHPQPLYCSSLLIWQEKCWFSNYPSLLSSSPASAMSHVRWVDFSANAHCLKEEKYIHVCRFNLLLLPQHLSSVGTISRKGEMWAAVLFWLKNRKMENFLNDERLRNVGIQRDLNVLVHESLNVECRI